MTTLLDAIIDRLANGDDVTVYILDPQLPRRCHSPHGTVSRYCNGACRCHPCRTAGAAQRNAWQQRQHPT